MGLEGSRDVIFRRLLQTKRGVSNFQQERGSSPRPFHGGGVEFPDLATVHGGGVEFPDLAPAFARLFAFFCLGLQSASWTFQCCNCGGSTDWSAVPVSLLLYVSFAQLLVGASVRW